MVKEVDILTRRASLGGNLSRKDRNKLDARNNAKENECNVRRHDTVRCYALRTHTQKRDVVFMGDEDCWAGNRNTKKQNTNRELNGNHYYCL